MGLNDVCDLFVSFDLLFLCVGRGGVCWTGREGCGAEVELLRGGEEGLVGSLSGVGGRT